MSEICLMNFLVVAATLMELEPFLKKNPETNFIITGIGEINTLYHLAKHATSKKFDWVIQVGIAGSYDPSVKLGESFLIHKDCFADFCVFEQDQIISPFELGFIDKNEKPYADGWLVNNHVNMINANVSKINASTVNMITDNKSFIHLLKQKYNAVAETMEGAAFHYFCIQEQLPFLQIRGISNYVGERDKSKWKIKEAIASSNQSLENIISDLQKNNT